MKLSDITFPVYKLGSEKPNFVDGVSFYYYILNDVEKVQIIDDKNLEGDTLAIRRLKLKSNKVSLYRLRKAIFFLSDFIKLTNGNTWFIDSTGKIFDYRKSTRVPLVFKPIEMVIPISTGGAIIKVKSIASRFKTLFAPMHNQKYAGLLKYNGSYILYGLYEEPMKDSYRMI